MNTVFKKSAMEQAGTGLEKILIDSLRRVPKDQAPLLAWPLVCGSAVAERTRAVFYSDGILHVEVADVGWQRELQTLASRYVAMINQYVAQTVRRIDFAVESKPSSAAQIH